MKVVAFTKTSEIGPSSRYRYYQFREPLRALGIDLVIRPLFGKGWFAILRVKFKPARLALQAVYAAFRFGLRLGQLVSLGNPPLVVIEHQLFPYLPALAERWLRWRGTRFTIEFDDAIWLTRLHRRKMAALCRLADRVVVGNSFLAAFAERHGGRAAIVPTTIDLARYDQPTDPVQREHRAAAANEARGSRFVIGWIGLPYNFPALARLETPLARLAAERDIVLRVVSAGRPELGGVPLECVEWSEPGEIDAIRGFDVGVMPLADTLWSRGKCGLKVLQYFAARVPVVASPVGVNAEIVSAAANGLLASTADEWYEKLRSIANDPRRAASLAAAGRRTVEEHFSRDVWAPKLASIWRETVENPSA